MKERVRINYQHVKKPGKPAFFTEELASAGLRFTEDMPVLFEELELLFRSEENEEENHG